MDLAVLNDGMRVLVVNAGSSSLKLRALGPNDETVFTRDLPAIRESSDQRALGHALTEVQDVDAVGHRVVHGGKRFSESTLVDDRVENELRSLIELAPMHQPLSLAALNAVSRVLPDIPAVACFDTAFHATLPSEAATYAVPAEWRDRYGVRRYGFHGLSHAYAARRAANLIQRPVKELRIVTCHLGAGASLAAVRAGVSVDTTMGFTPLEGLVMATRSGTVDPGLVLWLQQHAGLPVEEVADALEHRSGVKGLAGTPDMRAVLDAAAAGEPDARLAVDVYVHRLCGSVAAMAVSMGGLDVLAFTGGVGENAWAIRHQAAARLRFLGVEIDPDRNQTTTADGDISAPNAGARTLVVSAREDLEIAREVRRLLSKTKE